MTPDEYAAIKAHLYMSPPVNGVQYQSSFIAVLGDTRSAAERNPGGVVLPGRLSMSWLAATGYLVLLDQIGTCFETQDTQVIADNNAIIRALKYFSHVQDDAEEVVDTLRSNHKAETLVLRLPLPEFRMRFGMFFPVA